MSRDPAFKTAGFVLAVLVVLAGCSSDNDDDGPPVATDSDGTSSPAPGTGPDAPPSDVPGGDTSAVAGLWAVPGGQTDAAYVDITDDGLFTRYEFDGEEGNCYTVNGPYTLMLEDEASDAYSLAGEDEGLTLRREDDVLIYGLGDGPEQGWPLVNGQTTVTDLETDACAAS